MIFDEFASEISKRLIELVQRRLDEERVEAWQQAFKLQGAGSVRRRAVTIDHDIYERAAPVNSGLDSNPLLIGITALVDTASTEVGVVLE
ncbi:hypothetical protein [Nocardia sp. NPDC024068]|uniref:hypothetical protein n=1 Tax=Nocardia sp. NPDC024068 TaxID=3157197 RepID=UPI0033E3B33C